MKLFLMLLLSITLMGCQTVTYSPEFPDLPKELAEKCGPLEIISTPTTTVGELLLVVARNYTKYHECADRHRLMVEWYLKQKEVFDKLNQKSIFERTRVVFP